MADRLNLLNIVALICRDGEGVNLVSRIFDKHFVLHKSDGAGLGLIVLLHNILTTTGVEL